MVKIPKNDIIRNLNLHLKIGKSNKKKMPLNHVEFLKINIDIFLFFLPKDVLGVGENTTKDSSRFNLTFLEI